MCWCGHLTPCFLPGWLYPACGCPTQASPLPGPAGRRPAGHGFPGEAVWRAGRSKGKVFRRGGCGGIVSPPCPTHAFFRNNKVRASEHGWGKPLLNAGVPGFLGFLPIVPGSGVGREQRTQLPPSRSPRVPLCLVGLWLSPERIISLPRIWPWGLKMEERGPRVPAWVGTIEAMVSGTWWICRSWAQKRGYLWP